MRLLTYDNDNNIQITRDLAENEIEAYAILSHTWGEDEEEVLFHEIGLPVLQRKIGFTKIELCGKQAHQDGWQYFWVDTCCIDKRNNTELSEAILSMYHWYQRAEEWERLGTKDELTALLNDITGIPISALEGKALSEFPVIERMRWRQGRKTKREEDQAYCLLGIFNVSMSIRYGQNERDNAFRRLQKKLDAQTKSRNSTTTPSYSFVAPVGLCLGKAPCIDANYFIGRGDELEK